jgi:hypothetical protein
VEQRYDGAHVAHDAARALPRQRALTMQVAAIEQLHGVIRALSIDAVVEDAHDARVRELRQHVELAIEQHAHLDRALLICDRPHPFERDLLALARCVGGSIDRSHAAFA